MTRALLLLLLGCNGGKSTPEPVCAPGNWKDVSVGQSMACGVHDDGCIECWGNEGMEAYDYGYQGYGQYRATGDDIPPDGVLFERVGVYPGTIREVSGGYHSCGVSVGRELYCWGDVPLSYPSVGLDAVTIDERWMVGLRSDGTVYDYAFEQIGNPEYTPPSGVFVDVDAESGSRCAVAPSGDVSCWGDCADDPEVCAVPDERFMLMDLGYMGGCGVLQSGELRCWGGGIGHDDSPAPDLRFQTITYDVLTGILDDGTLWSGDSRLSDVPAGTYSVVSGAYGHACAISTDGELVCWGRDVGNVTSPPP